MLSKPEGTFLLIPFKKGSFEFIFEKVHERHQGILLLNLGRENVDCREESGGLSPSSFPLFASSSSFLPPSHSPASAGIH